jgi:hypothetical protein
MKLRYRPRRESFGDGSDLDLKPTTLVPPLIKDQGQHLTVSQVARNSKRVPALSNTSASPFSRSKVCLESAISTKSMVTQTVTVDVTNGIELHLPRPPIVLPGKKVVECPHCFQVIPIKEIQENEWRYVVLTGPWSPY